MGYVSKVGRKIVLRPKGIAVTSNPITKGLVWPHKEFGLHPENHQRHFDGLSKINTQMKFGILKQ